MGEITQEQFDRLLGWLDADRESAGLKYEKIRVRLIKVLACRGCYEAESLADETMDRVTAKTEWLIANYVGDPILYFYAVAHKVYLEWLRRKRNCNPEPPAPYVEKENTERDFDCLDECMGRLSTKNRDLMKRYYQGEKKAKIINRKEIATELGITLDALRIRAHRLRKELQQCVIQCLELNPAQ